MNDKSKTQVVSGFERFLVDHGFLSNQALDRLQKVKSKDSSDPAALSPGEVSALLLQEKLLDEEDVAKARAAFLNLPYVDLRKTRVPAAILDAVPEESRNFYYMMPFESTDKDLKVALVDPGNLQALEALEFLGQKQNLQIHIYVASMSSISAAGGEKNSINKVVGEALQDIQLKAEAEHPRATQTRQSSVPQLVEDAPIIKIVDVIVTNAIEANASDIHIEPSENDVRVRYRIDGILHTSLRLPKNVLPAIISRIKILCNLKIDEQRLPQDGRFHMDFENRSVDFRVSTLPLMHGEKVVMRILDKSGSVPTLDQLGVRGQALTWIKENITKTHGIFLITGPTGSGKSTTLYSLLSLLNTAAVNIITLEDPVEYFIPGVNQSQINPDIGLTFASGLRSILRQDPNVIMVGEIRDQETAELAVQAALTGHLVFSTLHTNNAVGAVPRLIDMEIEPFLLSASINLVMAQRLVRKLCPDCKQEIEITPMVKEEIGAQLLGIPEENLEKIDPKQLKMYGPKGCEKCGHTGYKGRFGIFEVMPAFPDLQELIFGQTPAHKMYEALLKKGMISMKQDGIIKVLRGETSLEEIVRVTTE
jgi:type IV pilus assembly protein PilB